jgi:hypothetical protein
LYCLSIVRKLDAEELSIEVAIITLVDTLVEAYNTQFLLPGSLLAHVTAQPVSISIVGIMS